MLKLELMVGPDFERPAFWVSILEVLLRHTVGVETWHIDFGETPNPRTEDHDVG
jgi:hypothetical protein